MTSRTRPVSLLALVATVLFSAQADALRPLQLSVTDFCFGDASGIGCPCGNPGAAGEGCANSTGSGAILSATGSSVVSNDDFGLTVRGGRPLQPCALVQGSVLFQLPFYDGIFCLAGAPSVVVEYVFLDGTGSADSSVSIASAGSATAGTTLYYQGWYRDPGGLSACVLPSGANFTQGLTVDWL